MSYNALIRPLKNGNEYNSLFPTPKEKKVRLGKGDTHTSIELIIKWALDNNHEVKLVAPKLQKGSLSETCFAIHDFLYNHFQYEADGEAQLLRSPAYAWKHRYEGIDCKSYSIIASCILLQLGVVHYVRKIKQPTFAPESFTHVYVIVPVNQESGSLNQGYYTIDGTLKSTQEPHYIDKKDFFMDKLQHYGLNGVLDSGFSFSQLDFSSLNSLISGLDCIGGSAYTDGILKRNIEIANQLFKDIVVDINEAVISSPKDIGVYVAEFKGMANLLKTAYANRKKQKDWNSCSKSNFDATIKVFDFFVTIGSDSLDAWLSKYFTQKELLQTIVYNNDAYINLDLGFWGTGSGGLTIASSTQKIYNYELKQLQIPQFELNTYTLEAYKSNTFNPNDFLKTLSTVLVAYTATGNGTVDGTAQGVYDEQNTTKNTSNAGMGLVFGSLALIGLATWGFSKMKDKGNLKTKN